MTSSTPQTILNQADVKATVAGYAPEELVNGITLGSRKITVSRWDLWPHSTASPSMMNEVGLR